MADHEEAYIEGSACTENKRKGKTKMISVIKQVLHKIGTVVFQLKFELTRLAVV